MCISTAGRAAYMCLLAMFSVSSIAQPAAANDPVLLDLETAVSRTLERNPGLLAFVYHLRAKEGQRQQSGLRPNPEVGLRLENALGSGDFQRLERAETTLSVAWVLERGKRERRIDAAQANVSLFKTEARIQRLDAAAETALAFLDMLAMQERRMQTDDAVRLAEQTVVVVKKHVQAGRTPAADLARAEAELARRRLDRTDIEYQLPVLQRRLAAQWGETQPSFAGVVGDVYRLPTPDDYSVLLARVQQNPNLSRYLNEQRLREAELRLAEVRAKPNWRLSAGIRHLGQSNDQALVAGITIPLATRNRNQGRIAEARAQLSMSDADRATTRIRIETRLFAVYQQLQYNLQRAVALRDEILPRLEQALEDTGHAYAAGRYGYFELRTMQAEVLDARTALVQASASAHRQVIEIERLTGTRVLSWAGQL